MTATTSEQRDRPGLILIGMLLAVILGVALRWFPGDFSSAIVATAGAIGRVFMRLLQMIIVPLVFGTVCTGIIALDPANLGRIGGRAVVYFLGTTTFAAAIGLALVLVVRPGVGVEPAGCISSDDCATSFACIDQRCIPTVEPPAAGDILMDMIPRNPVGSLAATFDLPGVIFFAILLAIAIVQIGEPARPLREALSALTIVMERITGWIMLIAPVGIAALILKVVHDTGLDALMSVGWYAFVVVAGLLIHGVVVLPLLILTLGRRNPWEIVRAVYPALLTAFSTASSSATLPLTLDRTERYADVPTNLTRFVIPLGATVNMNGTALYEAVAALFIAQVYGVTLTFTQQLLVLLTSVVAAGGAAGIPSAGLVTLIMVLGAVGLPLEGMALLLTVDRLLDMCRTTINVWGDVCGAVVLAGGQRASQAPDSTGSVAHAPEE